MHLILASTSPYKRALLERLQLPFTCESPDVEERRGDDEKPAEMAARLALEKAVAVAGRHPRALVIGGDQVAELDGRTLGKPGGHERAVRQLSACSGRTVRFHTAVALVSGTGGLHECHVEPCEAVFRVLCTQEINDYLEREKPYDCAGSFKCEGLGIALFDSIRSDDPTTLEGLPLISVSRMLRRAGVPLP